MGCSAFTMGVVVGIAQGPDGYLWQPQDGPSGCTKAPLGISGLAFPMGLSLAPKRGCSRRTRLSAR